MGNYAGYQQPQYNTGYVSPNFEVMQRAVDYQQEMHDKAFMQYGQSQAALNEIPTFSPNEMGQARQKFEQGFNELFAKTGGDFATHYGDAYQYLMNAKSDPIYNLNQLQFDSMKRANAEKAKGNTLIFKDVEQGLVKDGKYKDPSSFDYQIEDHKDWGGKRAEIANQAMQASSYDDKLGIAASKDMYERVKYSGRSLSQIAGKADAMLKTYLDTPEGNQEKRWYAKEFQDGGDKKDVAEKKAEAKIRELLTNTTTGAPKLFETKSSDIQNTSIPSGGDGASSADFYPLDLDAGSTPGVNIETATPDNFTRALKGSKNARVPAKYYKDKDGTLKASKQTVRGIGINQSFSELAKAMENVRTVSDKALQSVYPERWKAFEGKTIARNADAGVVYNRMLENLVHTYESGTKKERDDLYKKLPFGTNIETLVNTFKEARKAEYYFQNSDKMKPGLILSDSRNKSLFSTVNRLFGGYKKAVDKQMEYFEELFNKDALTGSQILASSIEIPITGSTGSAAPQIGNLQKISDILKDWNVTSVTKALSAAPQDVDRNGKKVQSIILNVNVNNGLTGDKRKTSTLQIRVPITEIKDNQFTEALANSEENTIYSSFNEPLLEKGITEYSLKGTDWLLNEELISAIQTKGGMPEAREIKVNYGDLNSPEDDMVQIMGRREDPNNPGKFNDIPLSTMTATKYLQMAPEWLRVSRLQKQIRLQEQEDTRTQ